MIASSVTHELPEARRLRLVVADVDGTLVTPDKQLTPRARAAVRAVLDAGISFTITSGRPPRGMAMIIEALQLRDPVAAFNGGLLVRPNLSVIQERVIRQDIVPSVIEILSRGMLDVWVYTDADWRVRSRDMPNDVLMFAHSGISIAMGNASLEVQRTARFVTTANTEDGFALAMEKFVLSAHAA